MARTLVYLDHSLLSNLAKGAAFVALDELENLVKTDRVLFPVSWTHWRELQLDTRLEDAFYRTAAKLSRGIRFLTPALIAAGQAKRAYLTRYGEAGQEFARRQGYQHDPDGVISDRLANSMQFARVTQDAAGRTSSRANKELFAKSLAEERQRRGPAKSFEEAKARYAEENVRFYFEDPQRRARAGIVNDLVMGMLQFSSFVAEASTEASMFDFFRSEACRAIPFIDIESSIYASLEFDYRGRAPSPSDMSDIETWAAYLPYADMALADRQMCAILNQRGPAAKYGCTVFPHTASGLEALVATLKGRLQ